MNFLNIEVFVASIKDLPDAENAMITYLSYDEKLKMSSYHFATDKLRFILARYILKKQLAQYLNIDIRAISLKYTNYGKPYFKNREGIIFNISHSDDFVVVVFDTNEIGVDIQCHNIIWLDLINNLFFTENEISYLKSLEYSKQEKEFYRIWTNKEAYIKAVGLGVNMGLNSIDMLNPSILKYKNSKYVITNLPCIHPLYSCAICYVTHNKKINLNYSYL